MDSFSLPADACFILDHDQHLAAQMRHGERPLWIVGDELDKRIEVVVHRILQALLNGESTLVCTDDRVRDRIQQLLASIGLENVHFDLNGTISKPAQLALQVARKRPADTNNLSAAHVAIEQFKDNSSLEEGKYESLNSIVFGDLTWRELVDKLAVGPQRTFKSQLSAALDMAGFTFTHKEYWHIRGRIKSFQRLRVLRTPAFDLLDTFHDSFFSDQDEISARQKIEAGLRNTIDTGRDLLNDIGELVYLYRKGMADASRADFQRLHDRIDNLEQSFRNACSQYGEEFLEETTFGTLTSRIKSKVSRQVSQREAEKQHLAREFAELLDSARTLLDMHGDNLTVGEENGVASIPGYVAQLRKALDRKMVEVDNEMTSQRKRMNARNIPQGHPLRERIANVETEVDTYISGLNNAQLFQSPAEMNALSLDRKSLVIKDIVLKCKRLREAMVDFEAYYLWRSFWSKLDRDTRMLMESLDILDDKDQVVAFDAWYLENLVSKTNKTGLPDPAVGGESAHEAKRSELLSVLVDTVRSRLQSDRHALLHGVRKSRKSLHSNLKSGSYQGTTDELMFIEAQKLARLFPVVFCDTSRLRDYGYYFNELVVINDNGADFKAYTAQSNCVTLATRALPANFNEYAPEVTLIRLRTHQVKEGFVWNKLPASDKLAHITALTSLFRPYLKGLRAYNCKHLQIISALGQTLDQRMLEGLGMPYKQLGSQKGLSQKILTETLLDTSKPVVILSRDGLIGLDSINTRHWQARALELIREHGLTIINVWTRDVLARRFRVLKSLVHSLDKLSSTGPRTSEDRALSA